MVELFRVGLSLLFPLYAQDTQVQLTTVVSGLSAPTDIQNAADGTNRLFIAEQGGRVRILSNGSLLSTPFLDIHTRTNGGGERGLLGVAFPPGFASSKRFYVDYTNLAGNTVIAMYRVSSGNANVADSASEVILMTIPQPFANHNGGQIRFGPDGYLYIAMGDGGDGGDPMHNGQNLNALLGKILRVDVESQPGSVVIPPTNPFNGRAGARPEVWAWGLRNPWRFSFDRVTRDLWIADVGQESWEEIDFQPAASTGGENYGWNISEGNHCYNASSCSMTGLTLPVAEYSHGLGCSVTGGFVYRGPTFPSLAGAYFYGDYCSGRLWTIRRQGTQFVNHLELSTGFNITTFGEDEAGEIYVADASSGQIKRIEATETVVITITSSPAAQRFLVDSGATQYTAPQTFDWSPGSTHSVTWLNGTGATRAGFTGWADGSTDNPRSINVAGAATYSGNFATQYLLTRIASPGGTILVTPFSDGYYAQGASVQATATALAGYRFSGFSGCTASVTSPAVFTITAPCELAAIFVADPVTPAGLRFVAVTPCRVMDTRSTTMAQGFGAPSLAAATPRDIVIPQSPCAIPSTAKAYSLNVTVVPRSTLSFLTLWPSGQPQPLVSTLNSFSGTVVANSAIVPAGAGGAVSVFATNVTDVIIDINGYFSDAGNGLWFHPTVPCRPVDTRGLTGQTGSLGPPIMEAGTVRSFALTQGPCALPAAAAYSLNATVVPDGPLAFITLWPFGVVRPVVSTLNSFEAQVVANGAIVPSGTGNQIAAYAASRTHLILDSNGFFSTTTAGGLQFYPVNPCRVADTRASGGQTGAFGPPILSEFTKRDFAIPQSSCGIPAAAQAYALNVTVVPSGSLDYLTLWPAGQVQPVVSTLNSFDGRVLANAALVPAGTNGAVSVYVTARTDVVIDISGYFAP